MACDQETVQAKEVQRWIHAREIKWFYHTSHNSEVADPLERWNSFLKSQLHCPAGGSTLKGQGLTSQDTIHALNQGPWWGGLFAPVTCTPAEIAFLVRATLRWFGDLGLQRAVLPPGVTAMVPLN